MHKQKNNKEKNSFNVHLTSIRFKSCWICVLIYFCVNIVLCYFTLHVLIFYNHTRYLRTASGGYISPYSGEYCISHIIFWFNRFISISIIQFVKLRLIWQSWSIPQEVLVSTTSRKCKHFSRVWWISSILDAMKPTLLSSHIPTP